MSKAAFDLLIVGQGLSGTALAFEALQRKINFAVYDQAGLSISSRIAPGIFNPVVFKRLTSSWNADVFIPYLKMHYANFEKTFDVSVIHHLPVLKLMNEEKRKFWKEKSSGEMCKWLSDEINEVKTENLIFDSALRYYAEVKESGWVDLKMYIEQMREYLRQNNCLMEKEWNNVFNINKAGEFEIENFKFKRIVFCEGYRGMQNPLFPELKFKPVKGDIFEVELDLKNQKGIWNKELFLQELKPGVFRTGSTYVWEFDDSLPNEEMKNVFRKKWDKVIKAKFKPLAHQSAVRPSSIDRRPFLGESKICKNAFVFNGMGTKGVMMAPYLANHLLKHIFEGTELISEVNIQRFRNE